MDVQSEFLASRYARALYDYAQIPFDERILGKLETLALFLQEYQTRLIGVKKSVFDRILSLYDLKTIRFDLVLRLLQKRKLLYLFGVVVRHYLKLYKERNNSIVCKIQCSHNLSTLQQEEVKLFMERMTKKRVFYSFVRDRSLIAGVRIESDAVIWENSISRELRLIEQLQ